MISFLDSFRHGLGKLRLSESRVLVAVSGGADSVAMLLGLKELQTEFSLELTAAHLDHGLRGADSAADAFWVKDLCNRLGIPCLCERQDVASLHAESQQTLEESARQTRYTFLERAASECQCDGLALAHTADDQAETILHHILRGTGIAGLRGIPAERRFSGQLRLVRPMLEIHRTEIEAWLADRGQEFRNDATNTDPQFTRNRIRHDLLPLLQTSYNPQAVSALLRLGQQASETEQMLEHFALAQLEAAILEQCPWQVKIRSEILAQHPLAFRRVCFTVLWKNQNWPRKRMAFTHWNELAELIGKKRGAISLPAGLTATRRRDWLEVVWNGDSSYHVPKPDFRQNEQDGQDQKSAPSG